nr:MAG TPA: hypothetical protein [Caudoviricetes sp.]
MYHSVRHNLAKVEFTTWLQLQPLKYQLPCRLP